MVSSRFILGLWKLQLSLSWTWDRVSAERDPVPEEEHLPEGGQARVREFFLFINFYFATGEGELLVLRAGMMRPNRGFILLLLNGTACLVRKSPEWRKVTPYTLSFLLQMSFFTIYIQHIQHTVPASQDTIRCNICAENFQTRELNLKNKRKQ